ncbi:MAG: hypothetical protein HYT14_03000 [Candidatus Liptonbacteria bacterium]|nr:hypothetical protein [Candidatus Liptonbacteria bacterium]
MQDPTLMGKIVSLCKRRGFIFPGSEIYGGLAGTYDYGPVPRFTADWPAPTTTALSVSS